MQEANERTPLTVKEPRQTQEPKPRFFSPGFGIASSIADALTPDCIFGETKPTHTKSSYKKC